MAPDISQFSLPAELAQKNESILKFLDAEIASAKGPMQQILRVISKMMRSFEAKENAVDALVAQFHFQNDLPGVIASLTRAVEAGKVSVESIAVFKKIQEHFAEMISWLQSTLAKGDDKQTDSAAVAQVASVTKAMGAIADAFVNSAQTRQAQALLGSADAVVGGPQSPQGPEVPEDLKKWVNPVLGKIR